MASHAVADRPSRPFILASITTMICAEIGLGVIGGYNYTKIKPLASAAIFFLVLLSFGFSLGFAPLTNVIMTEVVSLRLRDMSVRTAGMARVVSNFVVGFTLPYEIDDIGLQLGYIYAGICVIAITFVFFCVPDCSGKSLETIEYLFHKGVPARKFKSYQGELRDHRQDSIIEDEIASHEKGALKEAVELKRQEEVSDEKL